MRVVDPRQQGSRISWNNSLFEQVERVPPPALRRPVPLPEVREVELAEFHAAQLRQELRGAGPDGFAHGATCLCSSCMHDPR